MQNQASTTDHKTLLFVAGDVSGDIHCAMLVREILQRHPNWTINALGGTHLRDAGATIIGDTTGLGVIGFASALQILPRALKLRRQLLQWLGSNSVDGAVLCDWGAFNARLLPDLKLLAIPVLYYFPPRSWQKISQPVATQKNVVADMSTVIATPFGWSAQQLNAMGGRAHWVGHPLLEKMDASKDRRALRIEFGASGPHDKLIALLPGSRDLELKLIAPQINDAVKRLMNDFLKPAGSDETWHFVAAVPKGARETACKYLQMPIDVHEDRAWDVLSACDVAIVKSGTATLEAAIAGAPQIVVYDVPPLLRAQWKWTLQKKVPFVAMPNILLGRELVPELLGPNCRSEHIARETAELLVNDARRETMRDGYTAIHRELGVELPGSASSRTCDLLETMLHSTAPKVPLSA